MDIFIAFCLCIFLLGIPATLFLIALAISDRAIATKNLADSVNRVADAIEGKNSNDENNKNNGSKYEDNSIDKDEFPFL